MLARQQVKGEEEGKRRVGMLLNKGTLVPVWIIQNVVLLLYIGVLSWEAFYTSGRILAEDIVILILSPTCLVLNLTEILLFRTHRLHPLLFLTSQTLKLSLWLIVLAVCIASRQRQNPPSHRRVSSTENVFASGLIEVVILLLAFLASLALASLIYHRHSHRPTVTPTRAPSPPSHPAAYPHPATLAVHPAYRSGPYTPHPTPHTRSTNSTEDHCYNGSDTAGQVVEMSVSKGKGKGRAPRAGSPVMLCAGMLEEVEKGEGEDVFEMGSGRSVRRGS